MTADSDRTPVESAAPLDWLARNEEAVLRRLNEFLAIPSVSTRSEHREDVARCAEWLVAELRRIGLQAAAHRTPGHPVVLAHWQGAPGTPTILIYGHYDVQPPEPLDLWRSPPFVGSIRDGRLYARGAADDKGQLSIHLAALEAWLSTRGSLPVNVALVIEGEEEIGSPSLAGFLAAHRQDLDPDYVVISDTIMFGPDVPSILGSMRGLAYFELTARSAPTDLHSGQYGGVVANAAAGLARALASLTTADGRVAIAGFYEDVRQPSPSRLEEIARLEFDEVRFAGEIGIESLQGEPGFGALARLWLRPTCEVNGIVAGYGGEGAKTVIPSTALAKVSFRLVADQTPERVERLFLEHLGRLTIPGVRLELRRLQGALPWTTASAGHGVRAARRALAAAFERPAVIGGAGGTIPIVPELTRCFDAEILLVGFGLPGENAHAPNEWLDLDTFRRGVRAVIRLYAELGQTHTGPTL